MQHPGNCGDCHILRHSGCSAFTAVGSHMTGLVFISSNLNIGEQLGCCTCLSYKETLPSSPAPPAKLSCLWIFTVASNALGVRDSQAARPDCVPKVTLVGWRASWPTYLDTAAIAMATTIVTTWRRAAPAHPLQQFNTRLQRRSASRWIVRAYCSGCLSPARCSSSPCSSPWWQLKAVGNLRRDEAPEHPISHHPHCSSKHAAQRSVGTLRCALVCPAS